jgi:hypothetical protein
LEFNHLGYFDWIGAFSPAVFVFSAEFQEALKDAAGINKSLRLFDIVTGDNDALVGKANTELSSGANAHLARVGTDEAVEILEAEPFRGILPLPPSNSP